MIERLLGRASPGSRTRAALAWLVELVRAVQRTRAFGLAAETTFWLFLAMVPLAVVTGMIAARLSVDHWLAVDPLLETLPETTRRLLEREVIAVSHWDGGAVGVLGGATFVWLASSGMHAIFEALEIATGASRPWFWKRALALGACAVSSVAAAVLAVIGPGLHTLLGAVEGRGLSVPTPDDPTPWGALARLSIVAAVLVGHDSFLYWFGVHPRVRRQIPIWPGALVAAGLQLTFGSGYRVYLSRIGDGSAYSAGLAVIGVSLTGLYLWASALLIGAVINVKLGRDARAKLTGAPAGPAGAAPAAAVGTSPASLVEAATAKEADAWSNGRASKAPKSGT